MKKRYERPFITSEKIFSLTSQACDVNQAGFCIVNIVYVRVCPYPYKAQSIPCGPPPTYPVTFS